MMGIDLAVRTMWRALMVLPIQWRAALVLYAVSAAVAWVYHDPHAALRRAVDGVSAVVELMLAVVLYLDYRMCDQRVRSGAPPTAWAGVAGGAASTVCRAVRLQGFRPHSGADKNEQPASNWGIYAIPAVLALVPFLVVDLSNMNDPELAGFGADLVEWWTRLDQRVLGW